MASRPRVLLASWDGTHHRDGLLGRVDTGDRRSLRDAAALAELVRAPHEGVPTTP